MYSCGEIFKSNGHIQTIFIQLANADHAYVSFINGYIVTYFCSFELYDVDLPTA